MFGDDARVLADATAASARNPLGGPPVILAPLALQNALVCHVAQKRVLERVLARAGERRRLAPVDQLLAPERFEHSGCCAVSRSDGGCGLLLLLRAAPRARLRRAEVFDRAVPEDSTDDGGALQGRLLFRTQLVEAGLQHARQRRRHVHLAQSRRVNAPNVRARHDDALVNQYLDEFLDVERVALGPSDDQLAKLRGHAARAPENLLDELPTLLLRERLQPHALVVLAPLAPRGAAL